MTREQAIEIVGVDAVEAVEGINCEPTCRVGYNGACQGDASTEYSASVDATDRAGEEVCLTAYYYTSREDEDRIAAADYDGGAIDWTIDSYTVE